MNYFAEALQSDVSDIQQGTTAEGVHLGAMAGSVDLVQRVSTGIVSTAIRVNSLAHPNCRRKWIARHAIRYRGHSLDLRLTASVRRGSDRGPVPMRPA